MQGEESGQNIEEDRLWKQTQVGDVSVLPQEREDPAKDRKSFFYRSTESCGISVIVLAEGSRRVEASEAEQSRHQPVIRQAAHAHLFELQYRALRDSRASLFPR